MAPPNPRLKWTAASGGCRAAGHTCYRGSRSAATQPPNRTTLDCFRTMRRTGLRLRAARGHPEVQAVVRPFVRWLRERYEFPVRVPVYLSPAPQVRTVHGDWCSASFFAPWDRRVEPYIRLATGEYPTLRRRWGRSRAAVSHLISLAHEVLHYEQWVRGRPLSERCLPEKAFRSFGSTSADSSPTRGRSGLAHKRLAMAEWRWARAAQPPAVRYKDQPKTLPCAIVS